MKQSKRIPIIIISVVLVGIVAALLLLRSGSTEVEVNMTGMLLQNGAVVAENISMTVQGTILNEKEVALRFQSTGIENWMFAESSTPDSRLDEKHGTPYIMSSCAFYDVSQDRMATAWYAFDVEEQMLLVYIMDNAQPVIACSANGEKSLQELEEHFSVFVDIFAKK